MQLLTRCRLLTARRAASAAPTGMLRSFSSRPQWTNVDGCCGVEPKGFCLQVGEGKADLQDPFEEVPLAPREASPIGHDHQRQPLPVVLLNGLRCLQGRVWEPYLAGLHNVACLSKLL